MTYRLSERAKIDILNLFIDGIDKFGLKQASAYRDDLKRCFELLSERPGMGRPAKAIGEGIRRHEHGSHIILYEAENGTVLILALVPSRSVLQLKL